MSRQGSTRCTTGDLHRLILAAAEGEIPGESSRELLLAALASARRGGGGMTSVESWDGFCRKVAHEATRSRPDLFDDAAQEARIAVWHLLSDHPDAEPWIVTTTARRAAQHVPTRGRITGAARRSVGTGYRTAAAVHEDSLDALADAHAAGSQLPAALACADFSDDLVTRAAVREAVAGLSEEDRTHVWLRFWEGRENAEIAPLIGRSVAATRARFSRGIAPALRAALEAA